MSDDTQPPKRHKWIRLREHVYICKVCGCGKENEEQGTMNWQTWYYTPDGKQEVLRYTPPCVVGPKTEEYLGKYTDVIAAGGVPKEKDEPGVRRADPEL